jgi:hypothetical protein
MLSSSSPLGVKVASLLSITWFVSVPAFLRDTMTCRNIYGYNGHVHDNLVWDTGAGVLVYSLGSLLVLDDLVAHTVSALPAHLGEVSCLAALAPSVSSESEGLKFASGCGCLSALPSQSVPDAVKIWRVGGSPRALQLHG